MNHTDEELALIIEVLEFSRVIREHRALKFSLLVKLQTEADARANSDARARSDMQEPPA